MSGRQPAPTPGQDLSDFPVQVLERHHQVYRSHNPEFGACFFNGTPTFRFNLLNGRGTCYVGDDVATAVREKLRDAVLDQGIVPASVAREFVVSTITTNRSFDCADVGSPEAVKHRVSRMLATMDDYDVPQQWAAAFDGAGLDGVRYGSSYTNGPENAWALFGEEGEHDFGAVVDAISGADACAAVGLEVYDQPHSSELDTV